MGGRASRERQPVHQGPRSFYIVLGEPSIRYSRSRTTGPLIYDVNFDAFKGENSGEHAETIELSSGVPTKQDFVLHPCDPQSQANGYTLHFEITRRGKPAKLVEVYAGVSIEYVPLEGIRIGQAKESQNPFCVMRTEDFDPTQVGVETTAPILIPQLNRATFSEVTASADGGSPILLGRRLVGAPIAIVVVMDCTAVADEEAEKASASEEGPQNNPITTKTSKPSHPELSEVKLYTFLDFPPEAFESDRAFLQLPLSRPTSVRQLPVNSGDRVGGTPHPAQTTAGDYKGYVVKQLLQIGAEVYELDEIFDLGAAELANDDEEEDDAALCVICLTHPKDTTILPCRHMCLCYDCAGQLRLATNKCPICRADIERVMTL